MKLCDRVYMVLGSTQTARKRYMAYEKQWNDEQIQKIKVLQEEKMRQEGRNSGFSLSGFLEKGTDYYVNEICN